MSLESIFNLVEKKSHQLRTKKPKADGQKFWQPIKKILEEYDQISGIQWKPVPKSYQKIMLLPEFYIDGYGDQNIIEKNHFIIQTIRIPLKEQPSLRKIIQIALNIGQYTGLGGKKERWMHLSNYLTKKNINSINSYIPKKLYNEILNDIKCPHQ